jgi:hypothetical protein
MWMASQNLPRHRISKPALHVLRVKYDGLTVVITTHVVMPTFNAKASQWTGDLDASGTKIWKAMKKKTASAETAYLWRKASVVMRVRAWVRDGV